MKMTVCDDGEHVTVELRGRALLDRADLERALAGRWVQFGLIPGQMPDHYEPPLNGRGERWTFKKGGY